MILRTNGPQAVDHRRADLGDEIGVRHPGAKFRANGNLEMSGNPFNPFEEPLVGSIGGHGGAAGKDFKMACRARQRWMVADPGQLFGKPRAILGMNETKVHAGLGMRGNGVGPDTAGNGTHIGQQACPHGH